MQEQNQEQKEDIELVESDDEKQKSFLARLERLLKAPLSLLQQEVDHSPAFVMSALYAGEFPFKRWDEVLSCFNEGTLAIAHLGNNRFTLFHAACLEQDDALKNEELEFLFWKISREPRSLFIDPNQTMTKDFGSAPLHLSIANADFEGALKFLELAQRYKVPLNLDVLDNEGKTPFFTAIKMANAPIALIRRLMSSNNYNTADANGTTPLMMACALGEIGVVRLILDYAKAHLSLEEYKEFLSCSDMYGNAPIHYAVLREGSNDKESDDSVTVGSMLRSIDIDKDRAASARYNAFFIFPYAKSGTLLYGTEAEFIDQAQTLAFTTTRYNDDLHFDGLLVCEKNAGFAAKINEQFQKGRYRISYERVLEQFREIARTKATLGGETMRKKPSILLELLNEGVDFNSQNSEGLDVVSYIIYSYVYKSAFLTRADKVYLPILLEMILRAKNEQSIDVSQIPQILGADVRLIDGLLGNSIYFQVNPLQISDEEQRELSILVNYVIKEDVDFLAEYLEQSVPISEASFAYCCVALMEWTKIHGRAYENSCVDKCKVLLEYCPALLLIIAFPRRFLKLLLEFGVSITTSLNGYNLLHQAVSRNFGSLEEQKSRILWLLQQRVDPNSIDNVLGTGTPLHLCLATGKFALAEWFIDIQKQELNLESQDANGNTCLIIAIKTQVESVALKLIAHMSADQIKMVDAMGWSALDYAKILGSPLLVNALLWGMQGELASGYDLSANMYHDSQNMLALSSIQDDEYKHDGRNFFQQSFFFVQSRSSALSTPPIETQMMVTYSDKCP